MSRLFRTDRPFSMPQRAVWFFRVRPSLAHISGNVDRRKAMHLYELRPTVLEHLFERRDAIASTDVVEAVVCAADSAAV
ncbi:hypothetical protein [Agromyces sp. Soil535]|uniref:hypothetical protein n=1 Tax=Agromyces sp. Soil535 TaxID=1736390 RepID=UPI0006F2E38E|nr:hypothetical protein [Agromyces sp. Soil535]KRE28266.1 hypothetical protein ASG80_21550 [Agromyces sp. Soil535]